MTLSVFDLGYAERRLLQMEQQIGTTGEEAERQELTMECFAHSKLWIFGLYEIVRVVKQSNPAKFAALKSIFYDLAVLRMPLAKHEVKGSGEKQHYPSVLWFPDLRRVGWHVLDPANNVSRTLTRTGIANEFLSLTAQASTIHDA